MKENIEELQNKKYFKDINETIKVYEEFRRYKNDGFIDSIDPDFFFNLTDVILSDHKRALKENETLLREKTDNQKIIALAQNEFLGYEQGYQDGKAGRGSATQTIIEGQQYYIIQEQFERYKNQIEKLQKENEELKEKWDKDTHKLQNDLDIANAKRIDWEKAYQEEKDKQFELLREKQKLEKELSRVTHGRNQLFKYATAQQATPELLHKIIRLDYISKQKVKDKIEELNKRIKQIEKDSKYCSDRVEGRIMSDELYTLKRIRDILQELLKEK